MKTRGIFAACALAALAASGGCSSRSESDSLEQAVGQCAVPGAALSRIFPGVSFRKPTAMTQDPSDPTRFYVVEKEGAIKTITTAPGAQPTIFGDLSDRVAANGVEPGINGIAFHPNFPATNEVYIAFDAHNPNAKPPAVDFEWVLARYKTIPTTNGPVLDTSSEDRMIQIDKYDSEHNGGNLLFKNENGKNLLYVSIGDGSPANEQIQNHPEIKPSQDTRTLLGKMLRLDVAARQDGHNYGYPDDNPFAVKGTKAGQGRAEIYAWGLRNPWRFSFDRANPDTLWLGDVGQDAWEEIDQIKKGKNYGWLPREGKHCSNGNPDLSTCQVADEDLPVAEYSHNGASAAVIGGYVYHGKSAPDLQGTYIFGDYVSGNISGLFNGQIKVIGQSGKAISSFFEDKDGEVYVLDHSAGQIFKVIAGPCADGNGNQGAPYKFLMRAGVGDADGSAFYYQAFQETNVVPGTYTLHDWGIDNVGFDPDEKDPAKVAAQNAKVNRGTYRNKADLGFVREMVCSKPEAWQALGAALKAQAQNQPSAGCFVRNWATVQDWQDYMEGRTDGTKALGTVAMNANNGFTHFYVFNGKGQLATQAVLDDEGPKFAPQLCAPCHAGSFRGKGSSINMGSIFREFEPDALDPGARLVTDDPSGQLKVVPNDAATAQAEWFALNQSALAANNALLGDGSVPVPRVGQKFDDTSATPSGFDSFRQTEIAYINSMYPSGAPPAISVGDPAHIPASWQGQSGESAAFVNAKAKVFETLVNKYCMGCHRTNAKPFADYTLFQPLAAEENGVALLTKYTSFDPNDPQRKTLVAMPQSELMFNILNGLDTPVGFPTHGLSVDAENQAARQTARDAVFDWLIQASNPFVTQTQITFTVDNATGTQTGDWVYIVGSTPELGNWNPVQGVRCDGSQFPTWTCTVNVPRGATFQFKAIKLFRFGQVQWERERGQGNRQHTVANQLTDAVRFSWDDFQQD
jgi:glucose/arabinose dehydrogenase